MTDRIVAAAMNLADKFYGYASYDLATSLTCDETDALAELFEACHLDPSEFLDAHAAGDDEGDAHYGRIAHDD